jgi:hypothetical protein
MWLMDGGGHGRLGTRHGRTLRRRVRAAETQTQGHGKGDREYRGSDRGQLPAPTATYAATVQVLGQAGRCHLGGDLTEYTY